MSAFMDGYRAARAQRNGNSAATAGQAAAPAVAKKPRSLLGVMSRGFLWLIGIGWVASAITHGFGSNLPGAAQSAQSTQSAPSRHHWGQLDTHLAASWAAALDASCENYGGLSGSWTKCTFTNRTQYTVPLTGMVSVCYKGDVSTDGIELAGSVEPRGKHEVSLVCGGAGITRVDLRER